ncbi:hypothetical protein Glove_166g17 [Diversispora epigaea]|uniref:Uncharacterized protein n=1 Tax=Diversispora epigaea TaxID=1348612 RepID=A0A397IQU4_9GLOM|nr:hypothetical protein Glove_166g17 [Diversispora epigaea]
MGGVWSYLEAYHGRDHDKQFKIGYCFQYGIGTAKNEKRAFRWYLKSAEGGNSYGQMLLGNCYQYGIGTVKDEEKAFRWYLKSAEGGNSDGQVILGNCYKNGTGTTKDEVKTFQWYLKSAEGGNRNGQCILGDYYYFGIGTTKDKEKAFQWYLKSAEGGQSDGQLNVGVFYANGIGTTKDKEKAFQWYLKSAEEGDSMGQFAVGCCYLDGKGTTKDKIKAFRWLTLSVEGGYNVAQRLIEFCYRTEEEISTIKKFQNILKQNALKISESPIKNLDSIENLDVNNYNCSICWQTNSCMEICKNYFQDFGRCHNCGNLNIRKNVCKNCKSIELAYMEIFSRDFKDIVDTIIQKTELDEKASDWEIWRWIDYSKLKDIKYLDEGAFGKVWKAEWIDMPKELFEIYNFNQIAFKKLHNYQENTSKFLDELTVKLLM